MHIGRKLNVHRMLRRPGYLLKVLCTFNLSPVPRGKGYKENYWPVSILPILSKIFEKKNGNRQSIKVKYLVQWPLKSDCLSNELIISKLNEYGFSLFARKLMQSYFTERKQRTKINYTYGS